MQFLTRFEIDVAMYATHSEHVLIFDVRAVAPTIDLNTNEVLLAWFDVFCYVELAVVIGTLRISDLLSVHPNVGCAVNTIKVEIDFSAVPRGWNRDCPTITANCIGFVHDCISLLTPDERRLILNGIGHVGVDGSAVTLHFPAGRNRNSLPRRSVEVRLIKVDWAVFGFWNPVELPLSVQHQPERRVRPKPRLSICGVCFHLFLAGIEQHSGTSRLFVDAEDGLVLPVVLRLCGCAFGVYLEVRLHQSPLNIVAGIGRSHLPNMSARLTIIVVAELEAACSAGQNDRFGSTLLDKPLLIGVSGTQFPTEHLAFVRAVIAVVERHFGTRAVEAMIALPVGLHDSPHLSL